MCYVLLLRKAINSHYSAMEWSVIGDVKGSWKEFLDFEDCQREGLKSDYGTLDFVTCGLDYGISRCYLQIECNDEDKR